MQTALELPGLEVSGIYLRHTHEAQSCPKRCSHCTPVLLVVLALPSCRPVCALLHRLDAEEACTGTTALHRASGRHTHITRIWQHP